MKATTAVGEPVARPLTGTAVPLAEDRHATIAAMPGLVLRARAGRLVVSAFARSVVEVAWPAGAPA